MLWLLWWPWKLVSGIFWKMESRCVDSKDGSIWDLSRSMHRITGANPRARTRWQKHLNGDLNHQPLIQVLVATMKLWDAPTGQFLELKWHCPGKISVAEKKTSKELSPFQGVQALSRMLWTTDLDMSTQTWILMDKTLILGLTLSMLH